MNTPMTTCPPAEGQLAVQAANQVAALEAPTEADFIASCLNDVRTRVACRLRLVAQNRKTLKSLASITGLSPAVLSTAIKGHKYRLEHRNCEWIVEFLPKRYWMSASCVGLACVMSDSALHEKAASTASWAAQVQLNRDVERLRHFKAISEGWNNTPQRRKAAATDELNRRVDALVSKTK